MGLIRPRPPFSIGAVPVVVLLVLAAACSSDDGARSGTFRYDFTNAVEGWTHDFADLPTDADPSFFALDGGPRPLPATLEGSGYFLQGSNRSDDLFMFIKTRLDGLIANTVYDVRFTVEFATAAGNDSVGIGGSPGSSVFLKAGATTIEPLADVISADDHLRMNIDKGNQATGGSDMQVLGTIGTDTPLAPDEWTLEERTNPEPFTVTSNADGAVWLIVGTDSGFEGVTQIYFTSLSFDLEAAD